MYRQSGNLLLVPTTRDEVGQFGNTAGLLEVCADGTKLLTLSQPVDFKHREEETVRVPPGLYVVKNDSPNAGAPVGWGVLD